MAPIVAQGYAGEAVAKPMALTDVDCVGYPRISSGSPEFDRALGGGIVPGSVVLLGGDPGVGKSTLLLQVLHTLSASQSVLYVTGEESLTQVALRDERLGLKKDRLVVWAHTAVEAIVAQLQQTKPKVVVIDSIQTLASSALSATPGSVSQVRACTQALVSHAKQTQTAMIVVGHVTKDGHLAGPRVLEHMVDTVLSFTGEGQERVRLIRATKIALGPSMSSVFLPWSMVVLKMSVIHQRSFCHDLLRPFQAVG